MDAIKCSEYHIAILIALVSLIYFFISLVTLSYVQLEGENNYPTCIHPVTGTVHVHDQLGSVIDDQSNFVVWS